MISLDINSSMSKNHNINFFRTVININGYKEFILTITGVVGGFIASLFGGWDSALTTLVIFMTIDYLSGLAVGGIFKKSPKTENGALESKAGFKGLVKKGMILLIVLVTCRLDIMFDFPFVKDAAIIAFIVNETVSIIENAGLMGVPIPNVIRKAIEILNAKIKEDDNNENN